MLLDSEITLDIMGHMIGPHLYYNTELSMTGILLNPKFFGSINVVAYSGGRLNITPPVLWLSVEKYYCHDGALR